MSSVGKVREKRPWRRAASAAGLAVLVGLVIAGCGGGDDESTEGASSKELTTVKITNIPGSVSLVPVILPELNKAFEAEGIKLELVNSTGSPVPLIASGQADLIFLGLTSALISADTGGKPLKMVYQLGDANTTLYVAGLPEVKSLEDCKRMGTLAQNTTGYSWANYLKAKYHYTYDVVPIASSPGQQAALASGNTDCSQNTYVQYSQLVADGKAHWLQNPEIPSTMKEGTPLNLMGGGLIGTDEWLKSHRDVVLRVIRAINKSLPELHGSAEDLAATLAKESDFAALGTEALVDQVKHTEPTWTPYDGYAPRSVWPTQQDWMIAGGASFIEPSDPKWGYDNFVDMSYYKEAIGGTRTIKVDKESDSLEQIAAKVYGDPEEWTQLYEWNEKDLTERGIAKDSARTSALPVGTTLHY